MAKRTGRPPKLEGDRKSINFTFRSRPQMHSQLQAAAAAAGRSISEEIEYRLNQSFELENLENMLGSKLAMRARYGQALDDWADEIIRNTVDRMLDAQTEREAQKAELRRKTNLLDPTNFPTKEGRSK